MRWAVERKSGAASRFLKIELTGGRARFRHYWQDIGSATLFSKSQAERIADRLNSLSGTSSLTFKVKRL